VLMDDVLFQANYLKKGSIKSKHREPRWGRIENFFGRNISRQKSSSPDEIEKRLMNREIHEPSTSFFARIDLLAR